MEQPYPWLVKGFDGAEYEAADLNLLKQWVVEARINSTSQVYDPYHKVWVEAIQIDGLPFLPAFVPPPIAKVIAEVAEREAEVDRIIEAELAKHTERQSMALKVARHIFDLTRCAGMVWPIRWYWTEFIENQLSWRDDKGHSHWAGSIFSKSDDSEWYLIGTGKSPDNHNKSNGIWWPKDTPLTPDLAEHLRTAPEHELTYKTQHQFTPSKERVREMLEQEREKW